MDRHDPATKARTSTKQKDTAKAAAKAVKPVATQKAQGNTPATSSNFKQQHELTPKQEAFCLAYLQTGNASEAYRQTYNAGRMKDATIHVKASEILASGKIRVRLAELRQPAIESAQMTLESHLADLKRIRDLALAAEEYSAAITAETNRGKASGFYTQKMEHSGPDGGAIQHGIAVTFVKTGTAAGADDDDADGR